MYSTSAPQRFSLRGTVYIVRSTNCNYTHGSIWHFILADRMKTLPWDSLLALVSNLLVKIQPFLFTNSYFKN